VPLRSAVEYILAVASSYNEAGGGGTTLDERLPAVIHDLEQLAPQDQLQLADHIEQWLEDLEWRRVLNEPGPDALYDAAREEMHQGQTQPLPPKDLAEEE
jgi:hypothetical protein